MLDHEVLMSRAVAVAEEGIAAGESPFGAVVATTEGNIVFAAYNTVRSACDATAHAEVNAIRGACRKLGTIDLSGHVMAATCEPCPMCAAAIHWARLDAVIHGAAIADAAAAGFRELSLPCSTLLTQGQSSVEVIPGVLREACRELFRTWQRGPHAEPY